MSILLLVSLRFLKFTGVMLYSAGVAGSFMASTPKVRKLAVHGIASSGILLAWAGGYLLSVFRNVPLTELWILGGAAASFASQLLLVRSVRRPPSLKALVLVLLPLVVTVGLMVVRPTWADFGV
jgi:hypothetical protein